MSHTLGVRFVGFGCDLFHVLNVQPERTHCRLGLLHVSLQRCVRIRKHKNICMYVHTSCRFTYRRSSMRVFFSDFSLGVRATAPVTAARCPCLSLHCLRIKSGTAVFSLLVERFEHASYRRYVSMSGILCVCVFLYHMRRILLCAFVFSSRRACLCVFRSQSDTPFR